MGDPPGTLQFGTTVLAEIPFADDQSVRKLRPAMVIASDGQEGTVLVAAISRSHRRDLRSGMFGLYADDQRGHLLRRASLNYECAVDLNRLVRLPMHRPFFHGVLGRIDFDDPRIARRFLLAAQASTSWKVIGTYLMQSGEH